MSGMINDIIPRYSSELLAIGQSYIVVEKFRNFGQVGSVVTILHLHDPDSANPEKTAYDLKTKVTLTVFTTAEGVVQITYSKFGSTDYILLSYLKRLD